MLVICNVAVLFADKDGISRDITVEKEYNPTVMDADKINTVPKAATYTIEKPKINYSIWSNPQEVKSSIDFLTADEYNENRSADSKNGIFRGGIGNYWQLLGEFYYPLLKGDNYLLDFNLRHQSAWGKVTLDNDEKKRAMFNTTGVGFVFENQFQNSRLVSEVNYSYNGFDYYGQSNIDKTRFVSDTARGLINVLADSILRKKPGSFSTVETKFNLFSTNSRESFQYNSTLAYNYFGGQFTANEHNFLFNIDMNGELETGRLGAAINIDNYFYALPDSTLRGYRFNEKDFNPSGVVKISPYYKMTESNWDLSIGANIFAIFGSTNRPFSASANILGKMALVPEVFYLYGGITGDLDYNSYSSIMKENKYISPDVKVKSSYTPFDISGGLKIKVMDGLLFDGCVGFKVIKDQYFFVNRSVEYVSLPLSVAYLNTFDVVTEKTANLLNLDMSLTFDKIDAIDIALTGKLNKWGLSDNAKAWQQPTYEIGLKGSYKINSDWKVGLSYNFMGERYALINNSEVAMKDVHDINAFANYQFCNWMGFFANINNIANGKYETFYGYRSFGINGMIGVIMSF